MKGATSRKRYLTAFRVLATIAQILPLVLLCLAEIPLTTFLLPITAVMFGSTAIKLTIPVDVAFFV